MYRITSNEVQGLMEAYNAVYTPQELTEEQIWEEVETWVNSLVEEGYDLSDYTWEEMYEAYLNEMGQTRTTGQATAPISNAPYQSRFARPMNAGTPRQTGRGTAVSRPQIGSLPSNYRGAELQQTARARASQVGTTRQGTAGGPTTGGNTPIGPSPSRTAAPTTQPPRNRLPATRPTAPVAPAVSSPDKTKNKPKPNPTAPTAPTARKYEKDDSIQQMITRSQQRQAEMTPKPEISKSSAPRVPISPGAASDSGVRYASRDTNAAVGSPSRPTFKSARERVLNQHFDLFDIIKGHLLDEGYADTEEAAEAIMVSMSEDWKQSILEVSAPPHPVDLPPPVSSPPPVNSLPKLTTPPSVPKEKDKRLPKLTTPPPVPPAKIPPLPPVK